MFKSYKLFILWIGLLVYAAPFVLSLNLPFAPWDWLMTPYYQLQGDAFTWSGFFKNIHFVFFDDKIQFRPIASLITNFQYLIFKGEFWAWYTIKWIVFAFSIFLISDFLFLTTKSRIASALSGIYFLLHPMPFVMDVISQDGFVVFFGIFSLWFYKRFNLSLKFNYAYYIVFIFFVFIATLSKEIGISFLIATMLFLFLDLKNKKLTYYMLPLFLLGCFIFYRLLHVNHPTSHTAILLQGNFIDFFHSLLSPVILTLRYLVPSSFMSLLVIFSYAIVSLGIFSIFFKKRSFIPLLFFSVLGLLLSLLVIASAYPCPKYMPLPVMFFAILLGLSVHAIKFYNYFLSRFLSFCFIFLMIFSAPSKIYSEWFGMMQTTFEMSDIIHFIETKKLEGYSAKWIDLGGNDLPHEKGATLEEFFSNSSVKLYGYKEAGTFSHLTPLLRAPNEKYILLTSVTPERIAQGELSSIGIGNLKHITGVYQFERERYGIFEKITYILKKSDSLLGVPLRDPIDCQIPQPYTFGFGFINPMHSVVYFPLLAGPHFLYSVDKNVNMDPNRKMQLTLLPSLRRYGAFSR